MMEIFATALSSVYISTVLDSPSFSPVFYGLMLELDIFLTNVSTALTKVEYHSSVASVEVHPY